MLWEDRPYRSWLTLAVVGYALPTQGGRRAGVASKTLFYASAALGGIGRQHIIIHRALLNLIFSDLSNLSHKLTS
eukprot:scaffold1350_cov56-Cyclotella_meneghiniana.AAC.39